MTGRADEEDTGMLAVARAAGVSVMTVSRAIRGVGGVSATRRAEIMRLAREMNYFSSAGARALSKSTANMIGVSLPNLANDVFGDILRGLREVISGDGFTCAIDITDYDPDAELRWIERVLLWRPAAVVLTGVSHDPAVRDQLRELAVPTLETWDFCDDPIDICVGIDHFAAGRLLGDYAVSLGYRRPAFVGRPAGQDPRADKRADGFAVAFAGVGVHDLPRHAGHGDNAFRMGAAGMKGALEDSEPDVVFFRSDHMAFGGMMAALQRGLQVPGDVGLVGFNDQGLNSLLSIPLTTLRTPRKLMGVTGGRHLLDRINGLPVERAVALPVELVAGATTRPQP